MDSAEATMPRTSDDAFAYINQVTTPALADFRLMVFLEAAGQAFYEALAEQAPSEETRTLLASSAREELVHAERVIDVVRRVHGVDIAVPARSENPYIAPAGALSLGPDLLSAIVTGELQGEALYELWAERQSDAEVAALLRQNGREERLHSERAQTVLDLMAG